MTVSNNDAITPFLGDGTTKTFAYDFPVSATDELQVFVDGLLIDPANYTASLSPQQVVFTTAPVSGAQGGIVRTTTLTQGITYSRTSNSMNVAALADQLDAIVTKLQEVERDAGFAIKRDYYNSTPMRLVGSVTTGGLFYVDANGNLTTNFSIDDIEQFKTDAETAATTATAKATAASLSEDAATASANAAASSESNAANSATAAAASAASLNAANLMYKTTYDPQGLAGDAFDMDNMVEGVGTKIMTAAERTKLAYITIAADIDLGDAVLNTATDASGYGFVVDEDDMASDSATKLPTQQSVKAYVDGKVSDVSDIANRTALKALLASDGDVRYLIESGREGHFVFNGSDLSTEVGNDTEEGVYVAPASDATGASGAWVRQFEGSLNAKWFGATGDGTTTETTALQAAIDAASDLSVKAVYCPPGRYKTAALTMAANVALNGAGSYQTVFVPSTASITVLSLTNATATDAYVAFADFGIDCGATASVTGIALTLCRHTSLSRLRFAGCFTDFALDRGTDHFIDDILSIGTASLKAGKKTIWSSVDTDYISGVFLNKMYVYNLGNGVQANNFYVRRAVGCRFRDVIFNDANQGGAQAAVLVENDCQGCVFDSFQVGASGFGLVISTGTGAAVSPSFCTFQNFHLDQSQTRAISLNGGAWLSFRDFVITSSGVANTINAVLFQTASFCSLLDSIIEGYSGANGQAIAVAGGATDCRIGGNTIDDCYNGIGLSSGATGTVVDHNDVSGCTNVGIFGSIAQAGVDIHDNKGFFGASHVTTPSVPATTVAATNNTGLPVRVYISGGTVSNVTVNGVSIGFSVSQVLLRAGETIALTYSAAPSWKWVGI